MGLNFHNTTNGRMETIKTLVFDLDGTLIDSKKDICWAVNATLTKNNIPPLAESLIEKHVGTGVRPLLESTLRESGITNIPDCIELFEQLYEKNMTRETRLFPDAIAVFNHFRSIPKIILTNKSNRFVTPLLEALEIKQYFIAHYGRESFKNKKPDPEPLLRISEIHKTPVQNILMIGDTEVDIKAGSNAGTCTCAVTFGYGDDTSLKASKPTMTIDSLSELIHVLKAE